MKKVFTLMVFLMTALCTFGQVFTDDLHVTSGAGRTTDYAQKEVELTKVSDDVYKFTFRKLAPMEYKTFGDFVVEDVTATVDAAGEMTFSTASTEGTWTNVTSTAAIGGVTEGSKSSISAFTATLSADKSKLIVDLTFMTLGSDVNVVFGKEYTDPTAINTLTTADDNKYVAIYTLGGVRMQNLQRGINIVRTASGKVKKVLVK
uniref:calycin-like domain-containing protein n=1 Tax=Prevotella sp. TaxID=59823 RepID=UPI004027B918